MTQQGPVGGPHGSAHENGWDRCTFCGRECSTHPGATCVECGAGPYCDEHIPEYEQVTHMPLCGVCGGEVQQHDG